MWGRSVVSASTVDSVNIRHGSNNLPFLNRDITVIGAGIVGICSALHLQRRGFNVTLLDRRAPASETSFGNAGVISRGSIFPEAAPGIHRKLPKILANKSREARMHYRYLGQMVPWGRQVFKNAKPQNYEKNLFALNDLVGRCLQEHKQLLADCDGGAFLRENGWLKLFRQSESFETSATEQHYYKSCDVEFDRLNGADIKDLEPGLNNIFAAGLWIKNTASVSNPGAVCDLYAKQFTDAGGSIVCDELKQLEWRDEQWQINCEGGVQHSQSVVLALGAWTKVVLEALGYNIPMAVERGYHMHYQLSDSASLTRPIYDVDGGYVMSPMQKGLRVTTGVEWGSENTAATPVQVQQVKPYVSQAIGISTELDPEPWLGRRPCTPDSLPVIGRAEKHKNLWLAFGHGHMGFSMGPITGRIIADLISGDTPPIDTKQFQLSRF